MPAVPTYCRICEAACGLIVTTDAQRRHVLEIEPDAEHVSSRGFACVKGIRFGELQESPDRLRHPMKRAADGTYARISWEQANAEIGARLARIRAEHGAHAIAVYQGNPTAFNALGVFGLYGFLRGIGTRNLFTAASQDCSNKFAVSRLMYGSPTIQPIPDLDHTDCFVHVGANPAVSQMSFVQAPRALARLRGIEARGGRVVSVNPRRTESARAVGDHVFIRPGTDVFFLAAFLAEVVRAGGVDPDTVAEGCSGFDALAHVVAAWTPERQAEATGVAPAVLRDLASGYREAGAAALYCSIGVNQGGHGTLAFWLVNVINAVSGNLDRRGGMLVAAPPFDVARLSERLGIGTSEARSRVGDFSAVLDAMPGAVLADEILTQGDDQVRALVCVAGNPVLSVPNGGRLAKAMDQLDLTVVVDLFRNETAESADYLLPASSWLERADLSAVQLLAGLQLEPYVQYTDAVVAPEGEQRHEWTIMRDLARAAGVDFFGNRAVEAVLGLGRLAARVPLVGRALDAGDEATQLRLLALALRRPVWWLRRFAPHGARLDAHRPGSFLAGSASTDDAKVDLAPRELVDLAAGLDDSFAREVATRDRIKLIGKRERRSHNTWTHNAERFVSGDGATNRLWLNRDDAAALSLTDGDVAVVSTGTGAVEVPVALTDDLMQRVAALPHGWGHAGASGLAVARAHPGVSSNDLAPDGPDAVEPVSGMAHLTGLVVDVAPKQETV